MWLKEMVQLGKFCNDSDDYLQRKIDPNSADTKVFMNRLINTAQTGTYSDWILSQAM